MSDQDDLPPGFPGGHVPIIGEVVGDGEVKFSGGGNRMFSQAETIAIWGPHPDAGWKYVPTPAKDWVGRKRKKPRR